MDRGGIPYGVIWTDRSGVYVLKGKERVKFFIPANYVCVFRGDQIHAGGACPPRIHMYFAPSMIDANAGVFLGYYDLPSPDEFGYGRDGGSVSAAAAAVAAAKRPRLSPPSAFPSLYPSHHGSDDGIGGGCREESKSM